MAPNPAGKDEESISATRMRRDAKPTTPPPNVQDGVGFLLLCSCFLSFVFCFVVVVVVFCLRGGLFPSNYRLVFFCISAWKWQHLLPPTLAYFASIIFDRRRRSLRHMLAQLGPSPLASFAGPCTRARCDQWEPGRSPCLTSEIPNFGVLTPPTL